jgi:NAD(P)-dependent dehydrogenase (short-subunit alcohol dehydrogenase family)
MSAYASYPSLKGRAVFVSGGGSGIGASFVSHFAAQGAQALVLFLQLKPALRTLGVDDLSLIS